MSGDGYPEWKLTEKRIGELERRVEGQAQELSRLRNMSQATRDAVEQLKTAMLGNEMLGMVGLLDRFENLDRKLTKVWWGFLSALILGALLNIVTLYLLVMVFDKL